ncbi:MAG: three-Cys-motif partner protein TcmP [Candidatus Aminicenantes bacterium]|nr:three-Cys-motif partner protein TcmP [Candidatus Aminicenantes bacterium]
MVIKKNTNPPDLSVRDDGLITPEVGDWAEQKYRLLWNYADLFATSMKNKWDERGYIDLFAGAGYARIRGTSRIVQSSSLLALQVADPFDFYIFCDADSNRLASLRERAARLKPVARCCFKNCDVNTSNREIISELPPYGPKRKVLSFCFVDPYKMSDIKFSTIQNLSSRFIDFLILIPAMDPIRDEATYYSETSNVVSDYLGNTAWRAARRQDDPLSRFDLFITKSLDSQMKSLGYIYGGLFETLMVRSTKKNLPLYRLGFYSRNKLGERFWKDAKKYSDPQMSLF